MDCSCELLWSARACSRFYDVGPNYQTIVQQKGLDRKSGGKPPHSKLIAAEIPGRPAPGLSLRPNPLAGPGRPVSPAQFAGYRVASVMSPRCRRRLARPET